MLNMKYHRQRLPSFSGIVKDDAIIDNLTFPGAFLTKHLGNQVKVSFILCLSHHVHTTSKMVAHTNFECSYLEITCDRND